MQHLRIMAVLETFFQSLKFGHFQETEGLQFEVVTSETHWQTVSGNTLQVAHQPRYTLGTFYLFIYFSDLPCFLSLLVAAAEIQCQEFPEKKKTAAVHLLN